MRFGHSINAFLLLLASSVTSYPASQAPLVDDHAGNNNISATLFAELEELARLVDISYCVGMAGTGISKPFECLSRCSDFESFELVTTWNTGPLLSDSCGYIAISHPPFPRRIIVAFRGTYSIANTVADLSSMPQEYIPYPGSDDNSTATSTFSEPPKCDNCTVHTGFYTSWLNTRTEILPELTKAIADHPDYDLTLVGHSLGGAVAALASLDFLARGWSPTITTFGEPRIGNSALARYLDARFELATDDRNDVGFGEGIDQRYRRVTHIGDPVPLLPLEEWGYAMHAGEIFISRPSLPPSVADIQHCAGDEDPDCIASASSSSSTSPGPVLPSLAADLLPPYGGEDHASSDVFAKRDKWSWLVPERLRLWQLFFAHRDYFWRVGLCVPGGDPFGRSESFEL